MISVCGNAVHFYWEMFVTHPFDAEYDVVLQAPESLAADSYFGFAKNFCHLKPQEFMEFTNLNFAISLTLNYRVTYLNCNIPGHCR